MNIGIITFHCAHNYGAVLQAYSSKTFLESLGHTVYFIDYRPNFLTDKYKVYNWKRYLSLSPIKMLTKFKNEIPIRKERIKKYLHFERFINDILLDKGRKACRTKKDYQKLDILFLGSDQIWNTKLSLGIKPFYFGDIGIDLPIMVYAASLEDSIEPSLIEYMKKRLPKMKSLSVREPNLSLFLKEKVNIQTEIVVDPTLLLSSKDWEKLAVPVSAPQRYVLMYYFGYNPEVFYQAEKFAIAHDCTLKIISVGVYNDSRYINVVSPENFIWLFKNASFVLTNSYHGTAFSIINHIPFYTEMKSGKNYRIKHLCMITGYSDRIIQCFTSDMEWRRLPEHSKRLEEYIKLSKQFITNSLK